MEIDRRAFLAGVTVGVVTGRASVAQSRFDRGFARADRLVDGVYVTIADRRKGQQCYSNGGVIAGRDATLIVEGHFQREGAEFEVEVARAISKAPIRGAIDTHWHLDHTFGNIGYAERGIPILAHGQVAPLMKQSYARMSPDQRASRLAPWEQRAATATDPVDRARRSGDLRTMTWITDSINAATLALPTEPLAPATLPMTIDLGGLTAVVEFHRGHSTTDLIVRVPERDVVFTGDLLFTRELPVVADSDVLAWRRVLDRFAAYDRKTVFVPGHGRLGRIDHVREQASLMDDLRRHAEQMMKAGASVDEAERRYAVPRRFRDFEILSWNFTVGGAMRTLYAALSAQ